MTGESDEPRTPPSPWLHLGSRRDPDRLLPFFSVSPCLVSCECRVRGLNFGVGFYANLASLRCEKAPWPGSLSGPWSSFSAWISGDSSESPVIVTELGTRGPLWGIHPNSRLSTASRSSLLQDRENFQMTTVYLGIDVAKKDFCLANSQKSLRVLANTPEGFQQLIALLHQQYEQPHVVLEASGGYERNLTDALQDAGIAVSVVQPGCVRHFAKSLKVLAKTDAIDATVIARFGEATHPTPSEKTAPATRRLRALADRRTQLVEDRVREKNRLETCSDKLITTDIKRHIKQLSGVIEKLDQQVQTLIAEEADLVAKSATLQTATGVGTQTATVLLAHFPELGTLSRQATAAIAGLAPHPQESGSWTGKRRIYGGRAAVRKALYMAAKSAAQHCPLLSPFFKRLRHEGKKPYNVALIAVARKLLVRLNTLLKHLKIQTPNATLAT